MAEKYASEKDGQIEFYKTFLPRVAPGMPLEDIITDSNDGVLNGNLIEFKLNVPDLNSCLFQCIKYLSQLRIKGKPVPARAIVVDLNNSKAWIYETKPYLEWIEKVYQGGASKNNSGFPGGTPDKTLKYDNGTDAEEFISMLKESRHTKIHIDENCIVGWASSFYGTVPNARKEDFIGDDSGKHKTIGEIRNPNYFKDYIYRYEGSTNVKFKYLMDKLNDTIQKKNLGAFYTPEVYAEESIKLLRLAIDRVPAGNNYVIIDRCAGTGNLESRLTDDELSHCIVSTVEYYEYKVLMELIGSKVRHIIPPIEETNTFNAGLVTGADALSKEYVENPIIKKYIDDRHCTIILFENPPYSETTSAEHQRKKASKSSTWKNSYVVTEMRKHVKGQATNELGNAFIWSGFNYYLRQPTDAYVVYSPVKYWKVHHLVDKDFIAGYAFNRRHFHTNIDACIMVALWSNEDKDLKKIMLKGYDIVDGQISRHKGNLPVQRIYEKYSDCYYDKRKDVEDTSDGILLGHNGREASADVKKRISPIYNKNILGYMVVDGANFDNPDLHACLLSAGIYNGNGFYLRSDNYLEKLPMFCASRYITYNKAWTERGRIMKSGDGSKKYLKDLKDGKLQDYLLKCLIFTCLETQNHMRTFTGSDDRLYRNELCFDETNGSTKASRDVKKLRKNAREKILLKQWKAVLEQAKKTNKYDSSITYGVYQITDELDTFYKDEATGATIYDYVELHSALATLKALLKDYYNTEIVPNLFKYEFLK